MKPVPASHESAVALQADPRWRGIAWPASCRTRPSCGHTVAQIPELMLLLLRHTILLLAYPALSLFASQALHWTVPFATNQPPILSPLEL